MPVPPSRSAELTRTGLQGWLRTNLDGAERLEVVRVETPRATGFSSETALMDVDWHGSHGPSRLVARIEAGGYALFPDIDLCTQARMMQQLAQAGIPTPRVLGYSDHDGSPLGQAFIIMEFSAGRIPSDHPPYAARGWLHNASASEQAEIYANGVTELARLHAVPWVEEGFDFLTRPGHEPGMAAELAHFASYLDWVADGRDLPLLRRAHDWLCANVPATRRLCVNWGDPKLSNMIFDGTRPIALLDWELGAIAPADADVAFWLVLHRSMTQMRGHQELPGFPATSAEAVQMYERASGAEVHDLGYYQVWAALRVTTILTRVGDMLAARGVIERRSARAPELAPLTLLTELLGDVGVEVEDLQEWSA
jgi:aminoglycoside phosphotransferase (APT) family kinase protein